MTEVPVTPHIYSGVIEETVTFEFGRNQKYSSRVTMEAYSQKFTTTHYYFSKLLPVCLKEILNSPKTSNIIIVLTETFILHELDILLCICMSIECIVYYIHTFLFNMHFLYCIQYCCYT